jgi:hypothetical protein
LLLAAFGILVVTFLWVAQLLGLFGHEPQSGGALVADEEETAAQRDEPALQQVVGTEVEGAREEEESGRGQAVILGANYGLVLSILACILFAVSTLMLMLSVAGIGYSARALYQGIRYYRLVVYRALIGLVLGILSVGLHYLELSGLLAEMLEQLIG